MINSFWFNGRNSLSFGIGIIEKVEYPIIQEEIELIPVEGRKKGSLIRRTGNYKDIEFDLNLKIFDIKRYKDRQREVNLWLNYIKDNRLFFEDYKEKCYKVKNVICNRISDEKHANAVLQTTFNCEPFLYKTEESWQTITNNYDLFYIGDLETNPNIKLTLPTYVQNISIVINDEELQLKTVNDFVYIDSHLIVDKNNQSISKKTFGNLREFLKLKNGYNKISWTGNINKFEILNNTIFVG